MRDFRLFEQHHQRRKNIGECNRRHQRHHDRRGIVQKCGPGHDGQHRQGNGLELQTLSVLRECQGTR
jgi:hypothetical protein